MIVAALCLQASLLAHPLYLEEQRPALRSAQHILIWHSGMEGLPSPAALDESEAMDFMEDLRRQILAGIPFDDLALENSSSRTGRHGGYLGTYPQGLLKPDYDRFLFSAELGELSPVFVNEQGVHLVRRVETHAAVLQIQLNGTDQAALDLAASLISRLEGGADFAELAREHSVDPISKASGGMYRVFERGERNLSIKGAAFDAPMNTIIGPIKSALGLHIMRRVDPAAFPREMWDDNLMRVRGILVSHLDAVGVAADIRRTQSDARALVEEVIGRVNAGEDFAEIAGRFNDDPGGQERRGDLGWIHRNNPDLPTFFGRLFLAEPGTLSRSVLTPYGVVVLVRE
jgi:parvulin-like peptidyl-prolyl isomerase